MPRRKPKKSCWSGAIVLLVSAVTSWAEAEENPPPVEPGAEDVAAEASGTGTSGPAPVIEDLPASADLPHTPAPLPPASEEPAAADSPSVAPPSVPLTAGPRRPSTVVRVTEPKPKAPSHQGGGLTLAYSPVYRPSVSDELNSFSSIWEFGVHLSPYTLLSARWARGGPNSFGLPDRTRVLRPTHDLFGLVIQGEIPLTSPEFLLRHFQFLLPLGLGFYMNSISARNSSYTNRVLDVFAGGGARFNLETWFFVDLDAMYHLGVAQDSVKATDKTIETPGGDRVTGRTTGFDLRTAVTLLFP
jgi:hypothetical protein